MYSPTESLLGHLRGTQDPLNSFAAAGIAGVLYKSTGGFNLTRVVGFILKLVKGESHWSLTGVFSTSVNLLL